MTKPVSTLERLPRFRRCLTVTTALAGFLAATPAWAQTQPSLPGRDQVKGTNPGPGSPFRPEIDLKGNTLDVTLHAKNTIINWDGFNIPENGTAKFNSDFVNSFQKIAVLNRDVSGNPSQILGKLSSSSNVAVWVLNPSGIMVGSKANINTGSLVLSTLQIDDGDFLDGNSNFALSVKDQATKLSGITVGQGAKINVEGGNRGLVMVAPKIDAYGTFDAHDQNVAFVTASDVEFTFSDGSPLSVKINSGTAVSGRSQFVRGTVDGADAIFALASQGSITDSLLQVDARVTTATSGTRGIVLSAGRVSTAIDGVTVAGGTASTAGIATLTVGGNLTTNDSDGGSDILAGATGGASFTGALSSKRDILVSGGGDVTVANAVTAGRGYSVDGPTVTLGKSTNGAAEPVLQQANGTVNISASRALTGLTGLTLLANADSSSQNPEALTLAATFDGIEVAADGTATRVAAGTIKFASGTNLWGGRDHQSSVRIRSGAADGGVSLGNVIARDLLGAIGVDTFTVGIGRQSALSVGNVSLTGQVKLDGTAITTGALTSINDAVTLKSTLGDIATGGVQTAKAITIESGGALSTTALKAGGALTASAVGAASFAGNVASQDDLAIRAASIDLTGKTSTKGALSLTSTTGTIAAKAVDSAKAAKIASAGALTAAGVTSGGVLSLEAAGAASFGGDVASQDDLAIRAASIGITGRTISNGTIDLLGRTGAIGARDLQAAGAVTIISGAALETGAIKSGDTISADAIGDAVLGGDLNATDGIILQAAAIELNGQEAESGGTIDLQARVGGIFSNDGLALTSTSSDATDFIRVQATGAQGIDLSENSTIAAGASQALRVAVRNETKGAGLVLGDVVARALVGLSAADGDPATTATPIVNSGSLAFGNLQLVESFSASSTAGDLSVAGIAVTGTGQGISLSAPAGTLTVPSVLRASGNVTLSGGAAISLDAVESTTGGVSVTSSGALDLGTLAGAKGVTAAGTSVTIDSVRGGTIGIATTAGAMTLGDVNGTVIALDATGGDLGVRGSLKGGSISATGTDAIRVGGAVEATGGDVRLRAGIGEASLLGGVKAVGDYSVSGRSVTLGGQHEAKGAVSITSTAGGIAGASGLLIASDTDGIGAESLSLNATGGTVALAANSSLSGGRQSESAVTVRTDSDNVALGGVTAKTLSIVGIKQPVETIVTGDLSLSNALSATAANGITTGAIDVAQGGVTLDGGTRTVKTGAIAAGNAVSLTGGSITHGAIVAGSGVTLTAATGDVIGGGITSSGKISVNAALGKITEGRIAASGANGNVTLASGGALFATGVTADGTASVSAADAGADVLLAEGLIANGAVSVAAGRDIRARFIRSVTGALTVSAPNGDMTGYQPGSGVDLEAGPGQAFSLTVGRAVELGNVTAGLISITATSITAESINAGSSALSLTASKGDLTISGDIVAGETSLSATGMTSLKSVTASGALTLSGGAGLHFDDVSGAVVSASSDGAINGDSARAARGLTVTGDRLSLGQATAGGALSMTATGGDATLGTLSAGGDATVLAAGRAAVNGDVNAGGAYRVTGASVALGDRAVSQQAAGSITITAKAGEIRGSDGLKLVNTAPGGAAKSTIALDSAGAIALAGSTLRTGGTLGLRADAGRSVTLGQVDVGALGGFDGVTAGGTFTHSGPMTTGDINTGSIDVALTSGDLTTGAVSATGTTRLASATGRITTGAIRGASIGLAAGDAVSATSLETAGAATLTGSEVRIDAVRAASIGIRTAGAFGGNAGGRASLTSTAGDTVVEAGDMRIAAVDAAGALSLTGGAIDADGKLTASREMLVKARAALAMGEASAGAGLTLSATDAVNTGALTAGGAIAVNGRGVTVANAGSGGALALTSGADLRLGTGQATGVATIDAVGTASLGALSAGPAITVRAADAELTGTQRAGTITFQNSAATLTAMRLGDDTGAGGFRLSNAEVGLVNADAMVFDQGAGALQVGTLSFGTDAGRRTVDLLTTGAIAVDGVVTGGSLGRVFRFGGDTGDAAATDIRVAATSDAGGRLLFNDADLDLRADRIAVGLAPGFLDLLAPGDAGLAQALALIGDGNSALYNAGLGGGFYDPAAPATVSAHTLNVRFADFALFQNTGVPGQFSGTVLGGTLAAPVMPALRVRTTGVTGNSGLAIFGTINGAGDANAALLGSGVIDIDPVLLPNSRINGCLAGSGTGCLTTIVIQPVLQIFDWSSEDVFGVAQDVSTPFDPGVGGNNEELLTGLPALAPDQQTSVESPKQ